MAAGVQTFDPTTGDLVMDTSTIVGRQIAIIDASDVSGSVTVPGLEKGNPYAIPLMDSGTGYATYATTTLPIVTISGNVVSWTRRPYPTNSAYYGAMPKCQLILGVN